MQLNGRRIHIAGSSSSKTSTNLVVYAHRLVTDLVATFHARGASFVGEAGNERFENGVSLTFDWTILATFHRLCKKPKSNEGNQRVFAVQNVDGWKKIPARHLKLWRAMDESGLLTTWPSSNNWTSGGTRRHQQSVKGDILICVGGGEGVEHLATLYRAQNKPVIAFDLELGSSRDERTKGGFGLYEKTFQDTASFFDVVDGSDAHELFARCRTFNGQKPRGRVVSSTLQLLEAIKPPSIFFVRLLDDTAKEFHDVDWWFQKVVAPCVVKRDFHPVVMGNHRRTSPWLSAEIFENIRKASIVVADLTGLRPNCFTELGYALGLAKPVLITLRDDLNLPFDTSGIERLPWNRKLRTPVLAKKFNAYMDARLNVPPISEPKNIL